LNFGQLHAKANRADSILALGYLSAQLCAGAQTCGDDLTRANIMKQAASLKGASSDLLILDRHEHWFAGLCALKE